MGIPIILLSSNLNTTSYICIMNDLHSFSKDSWHSKQRIDAYNIEAKLEEFFCVDSIAQIHLNITICCWHRIEI